MSRFKIKCYICKKSSRNIDDYSSLSFYRLKEKTRVDEIACDKCTISLEEAIKELIEKKKQKKMKKATIIKVLEPTTKAN